MSVVYYCQHVLGIGHFHRSLEICRAIASDFPVTLILGGPPIDFDATSLSVVNLPGLQMDKEFGNLKPCNPNATVDQVKSIRAKQLYTCISESTPKMFLTELYPFGRKAFRFELDPVLSALKQGKLTPCKSFCSVRDILVEKEAGREKFEARVVDTLNNFYDGIFIHSDPDVITLEQTFNRLRDVDRPSYYTGFVSKKSELKNQKSIRDSLGISQSVKLIVASIGGGSVGAELLKQTVAACHLLDKTKLQYHLQIFTGPYCDKTTISQLKTLCSTNKTVTRFTEHFPQWLKEADLSISMAGYNSSMDLAATGIPALVYPFGQNQEQRMRAERLSQKLPIKVLDTLDLSAARLAGKIKEQLQVARGSSNINLDGAEKTAQLVKTILRTD